MQISLTNPQIADVIAHGIRFFDAFFAVDPDAAREWGDEWGPYEWKNGILGDAELAGGLLEFFLGLEPLSLHVLVAEESA